MAAGAEEYIEEQDRLTRLTGINAKTQNEIYEQALSNERFNATQTELLNSGDSTSVATAKRNKELLLEYTAQYGPKTAKAFADFASGMMNSEDAKKFQLSFPRAAAALKDGTKTAAEILDITHTDAEATQERFTNLAKQGVANDTLTDYAEIVRGGHKADADANQKDAAAAKAQQADAASGKDKQVKNMVNLVTSQRNQTQAMQKLINDGIGPVTGAVKGFTKGIESVTNVAGAAGGRQGVVGQGKGPPPTAPGGVTPDKVINFSGGTGDLAHFKQLQPAVYSSFLAMANDYYQQSGKKLQVNSAFRSIDEQKNVNSGSNPKAAPGKSLHNQGKAVDINSSQVADLLANGMLGKYGFSPLPGDPPHIQMPQAATGGILSGPTSGYQAMLHGTEAVVPMGNKNAITVNAGANSGDKQQLDIIAKKIATIDAIIHGMTRSNSNNTKILQRMS